MTSSSGAKEPIKTHDHSTVVAQAQLSAIITCPSSQVRRSSQSASQHGRIDRRRAPALRPRRDSHWRLPRHRSRGVLPPRRARRAHRGQLRLEPGQGLRARRGARRAGPPCRGREGGRVGPGRRARALRPCGGGVPVPTAHRGSLCGHHGRQVRKYPKLADTTVEDFDAMFAVNTRGKFLVCREAARRIPANSGGRIVTFSSTLVGTLLPGYAAYVASNAAVEAMTKILAKEVAGKGITANVVAPGPVRTELFLAGKEEAAIRRAEQFSMGRIAETTDIAPAVAFLVSEAAGWVNGQVIRVNGGVA